jgi:hypothetical protein
MLGVRMELSDDANEEWGLSSVFGGFGATVSKIGHNMETIQVYQDKNK